MFLLKRSSFLPLVACLALAAQAQTPIQDPPKQEPVKVPKVAIIWTYAENERGTSEGGMNTAKTLIKKLFEEKARFEIVSDAVARTAWTDTGLPEFPTAVEEPGQVPILPNPKQLLEFGKKAGVDYVCVGTLTWRVRSIWVGLGPKTKADATVSCNIVDVNKAELALDVKDMSSNSSKAEKWYESAGALLVYWGITVFSGGPKTPHIQKAAVKAIGTATDPFFSSFGRKIG
jgi:hypothetical protein